MQSIFGRHSRDVGTARPRRKSDASERPWHYALDCLSTKVTMLQRLTIRDLAVVGRVDLGIPHGMSVITGETGAGKSILVDALSLISGGRADSGAVREGSDRTEIAAEFELSERPQARDWLVDQALDEDGGCLLRRVVRADGGSRAFINGRTASLQQMRDLSALLVEIHGQHEHQALLARTHQLELLDQFAHDASALRQVRERCARWRELQTQIETLRSNAHSGSDLSDFLRHELKELTRADVAAERVARVEGDHRRLAHAGEILDGLTRVETLLGGDEGTNAERLLGTAYHELSRMLAMDGRLEVALSLIDAAQLQLKEALSEIRHRRDGIDLDPESLQRLEQDISRLHNLARKHRVPMSGLEAAATDISDRLAQAEGAADRLVGLEREASAALNDYERAAQELSQARRQAAATLSVQVSDLMQELGMAGGRFEIAFERVDGPPQFKGREQIEFLVTANAGMAPRALRKVASGGELARISLAIKVATIALEDTPVLVFDEVDSGIGGAVAEIVGRKLQQLGVRRQVLCVTHLAQVAACAHHHFRVSKSQVDARTESEVVELDKAARVGELARMLGGIDITAATRAAAKDLRERLRL